MNCPQLIAITKDSQCIYPFNCKLVVISNATKRTYMKSQMDYKTHIVPCPCTNLADYAFINTSVNHFTSLGVGTIV